MNEPNVLKFGSVEVRHDGEVASILLNRAEKLNAIDLKLARNILEVASYLDGSTGINVVLLKGAGRVFSSGADLHYIETIYRNPAKAREYLTTLRDACVALEHLRQPVIAAVHGLVLAGGLELMMAADLVVAEESTEIGDQHMTWGFIPGGGSTQRLPRWVGLSHARDLLYTGRWLTANEARDIGLVSRVVNDGELHDASSTLARDLASRSPRAMARIKELVRHSSEMPLEQGLQMEIEAVMTYYSDPAFEESLESFKSRTSEDTRGRNDS